MFYFKEVYLVRDTNVRKEEEQTNKLRREYVKIMFNLQRVKTQNSRVM